MEHKYIGYFLDNKAFIVAIFNSEEKIATICIIGSEECSSFKELNETLQKTLYTLNKGSLLDVLGIWNFLKYTIEGNYITITDCVIEKTISKEYFWITIYPRLHK